MSGIKAARRILLAKEVTQGTEIQIATALWRGTGLIEDQREVVFPPEDIGYVSGVDRAYVPKLLAALKLDSTPATFEQLPYLFEAGVKKVGTGVADGAGTGKIYTYPLPTTAPTSNVVQSFSVQGGDDQEAEFGTFAFATDIHLGGKPGGALMMDGGLQMRSAAPNSYTASTIAFVVAGNHITDSAAGLGVFKAGDRIKVTGGANDGVTFTVATVANSSDITTTETPTVQNTGTSQTLTETFTAVALPTVEEILFSNSKLYIDTVAGVLGNTQVSNTFLAADLKIKPGWVARFTGDGQLYFTRIAHTGGMEVLLDITFEHDGTATAEKAAWRAGTARQMRLQWDGTTLATAGTKYSKKALRVDLAGKWEKFSTLAEDDGNDVVTGTFRARYDPTAALFANVEICNALTALV